MNQPITPKLLTNRFLVNLESFFNDISMNGFQTNELSGLLRWIRLVREDEETRGYKFSADQLSIDEITKQSTLLPLMNDFLDGLLAQMKEIGCPKSQWLSLNMSIVRRGGSRKKSNESATT
ncbi:hypothetical protein GCK72_022651 [Caenorhabditis remanei]|uniref:Uncharacterized protein n=1 Tax=Caenorhabditis remanei TaxID=31234 RepID=A0A6A5FUA0_CAERE|nr:hypothetical protein GCK72_022651 [Caenorhabditis remanei]KAF1746198.1 hypothetical protein GCK72_022651 [Caenorhabditis remanei]